MVCAYSAKLYILNTSLHYVLNTTYEVHARPYLIGVYRVPRAGLEAWLGVHITFVSALFVVVLASTGVLRFSTKRVKSMHDFDEALHSQR